MNLRANAGGSRLIILDAKLGGVLVLASSLDHNLNAIMGDIVLQSGWRSPSELAIVRDRVGNGGNRHDIR